VPDNTDNIQSVERVYAQALLDLADDAGTLDEVADEIDQLGWLIQQQPQMLGLISSRTLSVEQRAGVIEQLFKGRVTDLVYRFLHVVNKKNRLDMLSRIVKAVANLVDQRRGIVRVEAFVAATLPEQAANQVATRIGSAIGGRVILEQQVQPQLIGGLKIRIGDRLIDGSVATQLRRIRRQIAAKGRDAARQRLDAMIIE
jgi:F-type H+-transporting ATPase subunit delta